MHFAKSAIVVVSTALLVLAGAITPVSAASVSKFLGSSAIKWNGSVINVDALSPYYKSKFGKGIWTDKKGLNKRGKELLKLLSSAPSDGLETADYLGNFPKGGKGLRSDNLAAAELFLSQAFASYARDLFAGRTTPSISQPDIVISRKKLSVKELLKASNRTGPLKVIKTLRPSHPQYLRLRKLLAKTKDAKRRAKIIVNMERWRWLPRSLGKNHVLVNQASFSLLMRKGGKTVDQRRVIVGKKYHKTPMFSHKITYAEFNPTWTVPPSIAGNEMLPKLRKDPNYLEKRGYRLHTSWKKNAPVMKGSQVDWSSVSSKKFPYKIVQPAGPKNALGQVKFLFPNKFNVYLHDTPSRKLFAQKDRALSHGCIRVDKPLEFAAKLLKMSPAKIQSVLKKPDTTRVDIRRGIPVHLTYFTVWVGDNGKANFYSDIYGRDKLVGNILFGRV